ncbi:MAG: sigma-70 family RNA polymerase sigma factor [Coleofasciculus sp. C2-GNP5-27]
MHRDDLTPNPPIPPTLGNHPKEQPRSTITHATHTHSINPIMDDRNEQLRHLIATACTDPPGSWQRRQTMSQVHELVMNSGKLWKGYREDQPYYKDALQQMWEYCCQHPEDYDPTLKNVTTWLDDELKKRLRRFRDGNRRRRDIPASYLRIETEAGQVLDPIDTKPSPPDHNPRFLEMWEKTEAWVRHDPDDVLRRTCFRNRPQINAQVLLLRHNLSPKKTPWKIIAAEFNLTPAEAKDLPKFYSRRCKPLLEQFMIAQGYIDENDIRKPRK